MFKCWAELMENNGEGESSPGEQVSQCAEVICIGPSSFLEAGLPASHRHTGRYFATEHGRVEERLWSRGAGAEKKIK